jgi:hypothetical protein
VQGDEHDSINPQAVDAVMQEAGQSTPCDVSFARMKKH